MYVYTCAVCVYACIQLCVPVCKCVALPVFTSSFNDLLLGESGGVCVNESPSPQVVSSLKPSSSWDDLTHTLLFGICSSVRLQQFAQKAPFPSGTN